MKRLASLVLPVLAAFLLGAAVSALATQPSRVRVPPGQDWSKVEIVGYGSGMTGFFNRADGCFYLYDQKLDRCVLRRRFVKLGEETERFTE